jgi:hypothetical protein
MRFLKFNDHGEPSLVERDSSNIPPAYGILSHTWGADSDEVTYDDLRSSSDIHKQKPGYDKIRFCAERADEDGLRYFWIDSCSINKANFTELSEAINSMFKYYRQATRCYVYLSDVPDPKDPTSTTESAFPRSRWFKRGWTLQELLAPSSVQFFSRTGELLGSKESRAQQVYQITGIDVKALKGHPLSQFSVDKRISWTAGRETKIEEDAAYSMLGIFDVHMALIYGEGRQKALNRLQRKVQKSSDPSFFGSGHASWVAAPHPQSSTHRPGALRLRVKTLQTLVSKSSSVEALAFSPDSKLLASHDGTSIMLWDTGSWLMQRMLRGHEGNVRAVVFSPDGKLLASGSTDSNVILWDAGSGAALQTLRGHISSVNSVAISPNGRILASGSKDHTIILWAVGPGPALRKLMVHSKSVWSVAFSPDGEVLASGSSDGTIMLWEATSGALRHTLTGDSFVCAVFFSPVSRLLASAGGNILKLWDYSGSSWAVRHELKGHQSDIQTVAISPDGSLLASGASDKTIRLWDTRSGAVLQVLPDHSDTVYAMAFSPDGKLLATGSADRTIKIWH